MKNDYIIGDTKISIPPTLLFSVMGKIADVRNAVTMDAKEPGDLVYVLGDTFDEMGGSEWFAMQGYIGNIVPKVDARKAKHLYNALSRAIKAGLVASCHDCSDGGLGVALAETAFSGGLGMDIDLSLVPSKDIGRDDNLLFSESQSRFVVTVHTEKREEFVNHMDGNTLACVGVVTKEGIFRVTGMDNREIIKEEIDELKRAWQEPLNF